MNTFLIILCVAILGYALWATAGRSRAMARHKEARAELVRTARELKEAHDTLSRHKRLRPDEDEQLRRKTIAELLVVDDHVQRALGAMHDSELDDLRQGIELIGRDLDATWKKLGVERIRPAPGEKFDAAEHDGIAQVGNEKDGVRVIHNVERDGFRMGHIVVRPARVIVERTQSSEHETTEEAESCSFGSETPL